MKKCPVCNEWHKEEDFIKDSRGVEICLDCSMVETVGDYIQEEKREKERVENEIEKAKKKVSPAFVFTIAFLIVIIFIQTVILVVNSNKRKSHLRPLYNLKTKSIKENRLKLISSFSEIAEALKKYREDKKIYPEKIELLVPGYIETLPRDPATSKEFQYKTDGSTYELICPDPSLYGMKKLLYHSVNGIEFEKEK